MSPWKIKWPMRVTGRHDGGFPDQEIEQNETLMESLANSCQPPESGKYGMFVLQDKPSDALGVVDVVALHGLNGHYLKTWTQSTPGGDFNWLRDFLPQQLPSARIMSYSYDSAVEFSKAATGIKVFAEQLLEDLMSWRRTACEQERRIIFVCHSLGGIVVKQAIVRAHERDRFKQLSSCIRGIAFFGTPHRGSGLADWGIILANIIRAASFGTSTNTKLINELRNQSEILQDISRSFVDRGKDLIIFSFYETDKMDYLNCKVVPEASAILNLPNETPIGISGNHRTICRFSSIEEQRYRNVWVNLQSMANVEIQGPLSDEERACLLALYTSDYESYKNRNPSPTPGTCLWILEHEKYRRWHQSSVSNLLWISADAGCGKSVLMTFLVDTQMRYKRKNVCYFFFKDDNEDQKSSINALCALLHQIYTFQPDLLKYALPHFQRKGSAALNQFHTLWSIFEATLGSSQVNETVCLIDGVDECEESSRKLFLKSLAKYFNYALHSSIGGTCLKVIFTSRPDNFITGAFQNLVNIRLRGEDETAAISHDVELVVQERIKEMEYSGLGIDLLTYLQDELIRKADRTFLWTALTIDLIKDAAERGSSVEEFGEILESRDIDELYTRLLEKTPSLEHATKLLQAIIAAARPLTLDEMNIILALPSSTAARMMPLNSMEHNRAGFKSPVITSLSKLASNLKVPAENFVRSLCGHFIRIINRRIYFVHQTARDYLLTDRRTLMDNRTNPGLSFLEEEEELEMLAKDKYEPHKSRVTLKGDRSNSPRGNFQNSIQRNEANNVLLDTCVSYLYLFDTSEQPPNNDPVLKLLDYAANYWIVHWKMGTRFGRVDIRNPRYLRLADPEFGGFEIWTSVHSTYKLNFPKGLYPKQIPGTVAATSRYEEILTFFGLEKPLPSREKMTADSLLGIKNSLIYDEDDIDEKENGRQGEEGGEEKPNYMKRDLYLHVHQREAGYQSRSMSHPHRGHSFPVRNGRLDLSPHISIMSSSE